MATEADDVPPLEDMSELLSQIDKIKEKKQKKSNTGVSPQQQNGVHSSPQQQNGVQSSQQVAESPSIHGNQSTQKETKVKKDTKQATVESKPHNKSESFGGFKKGFMFGNSSSKTTSKPKSTPPVKSTPAEDIPFIKKQDGSESKFNMPEVQKAMEASNNFLQNKDWVTENLLEKVQKNEKLAKRLTDPSFIQAINEFQTNPQAAAAKYQGNTEVEMVFKEFCGIMGDHFSSLAGQQEPPESPGVVTKDTSNGADMSVRSSTNPNQPTAEDERKMQEILSNPEVANILQDQWMQSLLATLRSDPVGGQRMLQQADPGKQMMLKKLVDAGILQVQR